MTGPLVTKDQPPTEAAEMFVKPAGNVINAVGAARALLALAELTMAAVKVTG
ncbi:hypothetical protein [Dictyobacter formicarum]|uniref:hypothetical protein n=1 Tax=Dictyobacter formicarum TaxID=2778368 RepID=UPI001F36CBBE|nr:hypothetical protein [Dictyobacter formicarum]